MVSTAILMALAAAAAARQIPDWSKRTQALDRALRQRLEIRSPGQAPQPSSPCAIPLRNVLKPAAVDQRFQDPMVIVPRGPAVDEKGTLQVPAPSCDDVKK
jgi:hypothetical protein